MSEEESTTNPPPPQEEEEDEEDSLVQAAVLLSVLMIRSSSIIVSYLPSYGQDKRRHLILDQPGEVDEEELLDDDGSKYYGTRVMAQPP